MLYYFIIKLDDIVCACGGLGFFLMLGALAFTLFGVGEDNKNLIKNAKLSLTFGIIFIAISVLLPTTKQLCAIISAPYIIENKDVQETVKNIPEITKLGTEYLKELLKKKEKKDED